MNAGVPALGDQNGIDGLLAAGILVVDGRELSGRDLHAAGVVSGRWQQLERDLSDGLGLVAAQSPGDAEIAEALRSFRMERGLLSAEDLRAWMHARALTLAAVKGAAARTIARARGGTPEAVTTAEVAAALPAEVIYSGVMREIGLWLADRILSVAATRETGVEPVALERTVVQRLVFEEARTVTGSARQESGVERARRLAWIVALDEAYRAWEDDVIGPEEVKRLLREMVLDWCRFELDELALASPGAADEAARQIDEGIDPTRIAAAAGAQLTSRSVVLADAPPELARWLSGAVVGDAVGPWTDDSAYLVARVRERRPPDIGDAPMVARARAELLTDMLRRLRAGRVRWHERI